MPTVIIVLVAGPVDGVHWVAVTVNINEYHLLGDPCFKLHFRMTRTVFEVHIELEQLLSWTSLHIF